MSHARVIVGLSGGVDSAVAALLLKQQGYEVRALFMKNWEDDDDERYCSARTDLVDAVAVADSIGIDVDVVNFSAEYKERVFAEFLAEYEAGLTPNPDLLCNAEIKFRAFLDHALSMGADFIATGHYARVQAHAGGVRLLRGRDPGKDQSYFLYGLKQDQLQRALFPVGGLLKREVRSIARAHGLGVHAKRDSTGICFIGERPFREFLARYLASTPGEIRTPEGAVVGRHVGLVHYTIGQRQGLGIGGLAGRTATPWYVARKDLARNRLIVVQGHDHPLLLSSELSAIRQSWIAGAPPEPGRILTAKTRYRQTDTPCRIAALDPIRCTLEFDTPQRAVTPGQSVVLYEAEVCLGGGIIEAAHAAALSSGVASLTAFAPTE